MKKTRLVLLLLGTSILLLSGCSSHQKYVGPALEESYDSDKVSKGELVAISARYVQSNGLLPGDDGIESIYFALQLAAEDTIKNDKKYFAIYRPIAISDFDGKGLGSAEAFRNKCIKEAAPGTSAIAKQARLTHGYCGTTQVLTSNLEVVEFAEKPTDITSYNAAEVITMIKEDGFYNEGNTKDISSPDLVDISNMGYKTWFASRRSDPREADNN